MSRSDQKISDSKEQLRTGIWLGVPDRLIPFWKDGANVIFTARGVRKMPGWTAPFTKPATRVARGMHQFNNLGTLTIIWGDDFRLRQWDSVSTSTIGNITSHNISETATTIASTWSIENFGTTLVATNGVEAPKIKLASDPSFLTLSDADFSTCEIFLRRGPHLMALNTSINDKGFVWSSADDLTSWTPSSANSAGDLVIRELNSPIICAVPLGDRTAVYGKDQMFLINYVGAPNYFGYKPAVEGIGAVSKKAVIPVGAKNYGCGRMGFWVTDGVSSRLIDDPQIHEFLQDDINWSQSSKINGWHDEDHHMVVWYYPSAGGAGEVDKGVGFDYINSIWTTFDFGRTSSVDRDVFAYPIATTATGEVYFHNFGDDADGVAFTASIQSTSFDLDHPDHIKSLRNVRLDWTGTGMEWRIGLQSDLDDAITWTGWVAAPTGFIQSDVRLSARYMSLEFRSEGIGDTWELSGITTYGRLGGTR